VYAKGKHSEAEMIGVLKQLEAGRKAADVARELGVSKHTIYAWARMPSLNLRASRERSEKYATVSIGM
jgi:transposase-like protein